MVVDRPDMVRTSFLTKRLAITDLKVEVNRLAKKKELTAAFEGMPPLFHTALDSVLTTFVMLSCAIEFQDGSSQQHLTSSTPHGLLSASGLLSTLDTVTGYIWTGECSRTPQLPQCAGDQPMACQAWARCAHACISLASSQVPITAYA